MKETLKNVMAMSFVSRLVVRLVLGILVVGTLVGRPAVANDTAIGIMETVIVDGEETLVPRTLSEFMAAQAQANFFSIRPNVTTSTLGKVTPPHSHDQEWFCFYVLTGIIQKNCDITLTLSREPNSGGHDHDDPTRPLGKWEPPSGSSGNNGIFESTYTSDEVSGIVRLKAIGDFNGIVFGPNNLTIEVANPGLIILGPGTNYNLIGSKPGKHVVNHFGTANFNQKLVKMANDFAALYPGFKLEYNDISLVTGGIFDLDLNWKPLHKAHRFGVDVDINVRGMSVGQLKDLNFIIKKKVRFALILRYEDPPGVPSHWHVR